MDSWLVAVAAAAAAGSFSQYWQNLTTDRNDFPEVSSAATEIGKAVTRKDLVHIFTRIWKLQKDVSPDGREFSKRKISDIYELNVASPAEMDSAIEKMRRSGNHMDCNVISQSLGLLTGENITEDQCGKGPRAESVSGSAKSSITRIDSFNEAMRRRRRRRRRRSSLKTKYPYRCFLKPISSLDSCLMAQLHMQHIKMEEYVLSSLPTPTTPILRPLLITDGNRMINRASGEFSNESNGTRNSKLHTQDTFEMNGYVYTIPPLPKTVFSDLPEKKTGNDCNGRLSIPCKIDTEKQFHSRWGHYGRVILFCLGISIGIICSYLGNRKEVEKLRGLLKQSENLVQDLQEELEMKDSLTVKELGSENHELHETYDNSYPDGAMNLSSLELSTDNVTRFNDKESYHQKVEESSESTSKIEAELEAELERSTQIL